MLEFLFILGPAVEQKFSCTSYDQSHSIMWYISMRVFRVCILKLSQSAGKGKGWALVGVREDASSSSPTGLPKELRRRATDGSEQFKGLVAFSSLKMRENIHANLNFILVYQRMHSLLSSSYSVVTPLLERSFEH